MKSFLEMQDYSQALCQYYCRISVAAANYCNCSMRNFGVETNVSQFLFDCTEETKSVDSKVEFPCRDLLNLNEIMFNRNENFEKFKSREINSICRQCPIECESISYDPDINYGWLFEERKMNCTDESSEGELKIRVTKNIHLHTEEIDYPLLEFFSEFIGILGAYMGVSICTLGEIIGFFFIVYQNKKQEKKKKCYDFGTQVGTINFRSDSDSSRSSRSRNLTDESIWWKSDIITLVNQRSFDTIA